MTNRRTLNPYLTKDLRVGDKEKIPEVMSILKKLLSPPPKSADEYAFYLHILGNCFQDRMVSSEQEKKTNVNEALRAYRQALAKITPSSAPFLYFHICQALGDLYFDNGTSDDLLIESGTHYRNALSATPYFGLEEIQQLGRYIFYHEISWMHPSIALGLFLNKQFLEAILFFELGKSLSLREYLLLNNAISDPRLNEKQRHDFFEFRKSLTILETADANLDFRMQHADDFNTAEFRRDNQEVMKTSNFMTKDWFQLLGLTRLC